MKKLLAAFFAFLSLSAAAQEKTFHDADAVTRTLNGSFNAITVSDGVDLYLTQGNEESVAVSAADAKYLDRFKTEVVNGVLKIYYDYKGINWAINEKRKLRAWVSFKTLEKLQASGGADVDMQGSLNVNAFEMKCSSGASFEGKLSVKALTIEQNSGSTVNLSGDAGTVKVDVSSGAVFKGFDLAVDYCDAKASSGGGVRITINKELNAKANSGGGIKYKGNAVIKDLNVNSGGSVKKA